MRGGERGFNVVAELAGDGLPTHGLSADILVATEDAKER